MRLSAIGTVGWLVAMVLIGAGSQATGVLFAAEPASTGEDLLRLVKVLYGESRQAVRSVEYDYTFNLNGGVRRARYARDGERVYSAGVWTSGEAFSMPGESAWDGQHVRERWTPGQMNRSVDKSRFKESTPSPEQELFLYPQYALGFAKFARGKFEFTRARYVEDVKHGTCVELEFDVAAAKGTLLCRHARRYGYAPVYWRFTFKDGPQREGSEEMSAERFATFESDGNEMYFPVTISCVNGGTSPDGTPISSRRHYQVDEPTLKVNQPIPRSRFVLQPWPNEDVFDMEKGVVTYAKDPRWSPAGKVDFPWADFVALAERNKAKRMGTLAQTGGFGGDAALPEPAAPWIERLGRPMVLAGLTVVIVSGLLVYRRFRPRVVPPQRAQ